jgi:hypothetical protein
MTPERRKRWNFVLRDDGQWAWHVVNTDGSEASSATSFDTLKQCTEDATRHGYVVWKPEQDRRS